jgi:hypothetical protein
LALFATTFLIGRLQPLAYASAGSTLRSQAEMDLAQLVHQLGPHGRAAVAEQLGANAITVTVTVQSTTESFMHFHRNSAISIALHGRSHEAPKTSS